ncbi:MAG: hypothetical protein LBL32_02940 [Holosporales bacterium]|jgi:hypothetical protein|nr:hypothetical protein [Holosporales bacterium]
MFSITKALVLAVMGITTLLSISAASDSPLTSKNVLVQLNPVELHTDTIVDNIGNAQFRIMREDVSFEGNSKLAICLRSFANLLLKLKSTPEPDIFDIIVSLDGDGVASATALASVCHLLEARIARASSLKYPDRQWPLSSVVDVVCGCGTGALVANILALGIPITEAIISDIQVLPWMSLLKTCPAGCVSGAATAIDVGSNVTSAYYGKTAAADESTVRGKPSDHDACNLSKISKAAVIQHISTASNDDLKTSLVLVASNISDSICLSVLNAISAKDRDTAARFKKWGFSETMFILNGIISTCDTATKGTAVGKARELFPKIPLAVLQADDTKPCAISSIQSSLLAQKTLQKDLILINFASEVTDVPCVIPSLRFDVTYTDNNLLIISVGAKILIPAKQALSTSKKNRNRMFADIFSATKNLFIPPSGGRKNTAQTVFSALTDFLAMCNCHAVPNYKFISPSGIDRSSSDVPDFSPIPTVNDARMASLSSLAGINHEISDESDHFPDSTTSDSDSKASDQSKTLSSADSTSESDRSNDKSSDNRANSDSNHTENSSSPTTDGLSDEEEIDQIQLLVA